MADNIDRDFDIIPLLRTDVTFDMDQPVFQNNGTQLLENSDLSNLPADGTVLYLNDLLLDEASSVLIKSAAEDLVHLVVDENPVQSDVIENTVLNQGQEITSSHYYYEFPNDLKVYSEHSLSLILIDG